GRGAPATYGAPAGHEGRPIHYLTAFPTPVRLGREGLVSRGFLEGTFHGRLDRGGPDAPGRGLRREGEPGARPAHDPGADPDPAPANATFAPPLRHGRGCGAHDARAPRGVRASRDRGTPGRDHHRARPSAEARAGG